jgi:hypothetical protein
MSRFILLLVLFLTLTGTGSSQSTAVPPPAFVVSGPAIVAFFPPAPQSDLEASDGANEALSDFQFYADSVIVPLQKAGIRFEQAYSRSFRIRVGSKTKTVRPRKDRAGYYFIAPGRNPHIQYGVMTDEDILDAAQGYFGTSIPRESCKGPHCSKLDLSGSICWCKTRTMRILPGSAR